MKLMLDYSVSKQTKISSDQTMTMTILDSYVL